MDKHWEEKIEKAAEISKRHGFDEQKEEFWARQPAGVISLLLMVDKEEENAI